MKLSARVALLLAASAAVLPGASALAADYDPPVVMNDAPEEVPVEVGSGWYLRGDLGYVVGSSSGAFSYRTFDGVNYGSEDFTTGEMSKPFTYGIGFGYHFNDMLRADITADAMRARFNGTTDTVGCFGVATTCRSEDTSEMSGVSVMASGYVDLGTISGFTPYVGAGAGMTYVSWGDLSSVNYCTGAGCPVATFDTANDGVKDWRFTWQAMAGVAYKINDALKLDVGYRYRQIDKGNMFNWDAALAAAGATGVQGTSGKLSQHEVRVGLRYDLW